MKSHLVVVFLRGLQDSESAVKTTNGADIIIDRVDNEGERAARCNSIKALTLL